MTYTLAYYDMELIADLDFLIMQAPISPKVKILSLPYLMVRQCFEPDHDLAEVVDDTDEADGGQDEQQDKDQRVSKHSLQRGRPTSQFEVLASEIIRLVLKTPLTQHNITLQLLC